MSSQDCCVKVHSHCCNKQKVKEPETSAFRNLKDPQYLRSYFKSDDSADLNLFNGSSTTFFQPKTNQNLKIPRARKSQ